MQTLLVAAIALLVFAWVALPLRRGPRRDKPQPSQELEEVNARKRSALMAIVDIENERAVGKLSKVDFDALKAEYETQALGALRAADSLQDSQRDRQDLGDDELEIEIAAIRERLRCPSCGAARRPGATCDQCGA